MQIIIEGYQYPAGSVDIVRLPDPIPCRGDVGMWTLDADVVRLEKNQPWGSKFMQRVSADLKVWMPEAKCFSPTNLKYMRRFFKLYCPAPIVQQVADRLPIQQFEGSFPSVAGRVDHLPRKGSGHGAVRP